MGNILEMKLEFAKSWNYSLFKIHSSGYPLAYLSSTSDMSIIGLHMINSKNCFALDLFAISTIIVDLLTVMSVFNDCGLHFFSLLSKVLDNTTLYSGDRLLSSICFINDE